MDPSVRTVAAQPEWADGPFGNTEATRVNINDFISIDGVVLRPHKNRQSMSDRIIIGRKGAGKTLYMRMLQDAARERDFFVYGQIDPLTTTTILEVHKQGEIYANTRIATDSPISLVVDRRQSLISFWRLVWDRALLISASTLFLSSRDFDQGLDRSEPGVSEALLRVRTQVAANRRELYPRFADLLPDSITYYSPSNCLRYIADRLGGQKGFKFLDDIRWTEIRRIVVECIKISPPIGLYVDPVDDEYEAAPEPWLLCQAGLFRAVFEFMYSGDNISNRFHIVAALRDVVYAALLKTEHGLRFIDDEHVRILDWSNVHLRMFFFEKLRQLQNRGTLSFSSRVADPVASWLGFSEVRNEVRNIKEDVTDYLIRHCRMVPRDIIVLGNAIAAEQKRRVAIAGKTFGQESLRRVVAEVARLFAQQSIRIAILELMSSFDYFFELTRDGIDSTVVTLDELRRSFEGRVHRFFATIKTETFLFSDLKLALLSAGLAREEDFAPHEEAYYRFDNLLWRHGMIAYQQKEGNRWRWKYNWRVKADGDRLPASGMLLGFHPCLIDYFDLEVRADGPVF